MIWKVLNEFPDEWTYPELNPVVLIFGNPSNFIVHIQASVRIAIAIGLIIL